MVFAGSRFATLTATSCSSVDQGRRWGSNPGFNPDILSSGVLLFGLESAADPEHVAIGMAKVHLPPVTREQLLSIQAASRLGRDRDSVRPACNAHFGHFLPQLYEREVARTDKTQRRKENVSGVLSKKAQLTRQPSATVPRYTRGSFSPIRQPARGVAFEKEGEEKMR